MRFVSLMDLLMVIGDIKFIELLLLRRVSEERTHDVVDKVFGWKVLLSEIIWRLQVQSQQQVRLTRNTYNNLTHILGHG